jgi:hypothetical protein
MVSVATRRGSVAARRVILATPLHTSVKLLGGHPPLARLLAPLHDIGSEPICTIYLQYPPEVRLDAPFVGVVGMHTQWVFDRRVCGSPGLMAVVIGADGPHMEQDNAELSGRISAELGHLFPHWPPPQQIKVIREKRATFTSTPGIDARRPGAETPVRGLWLAGDYTATDLPATLEGAVMSGIHCARALIAAVRNPVTA